jgi:hypothetical protein
VRDGQLQSYLPRSRDEDQPKKALESMLDTAALFVDEQLLSSIEFQGNRSDFLSQFRSAIDAIKPFSRAFRHQFDPGAVHEEILQHLASVIIDSDLSALCERADREGPARVGHRIPPAFRDDDKPENKLGDLIIWFEIINLSKIRSGGFSKYLFLTNDQKSDWVYAPQKRAEIIRGIRRFISNKDPAIKIIDPRLVSEFGRVVGSSQVSICSLPSLVEAISRLRPTDVGQLAAAIQINLASQIPDNPPEKDFIGLNNSLEEKNAADTSGDADKSLPSITDGEQKDLAIGVPAQVTEHPKINSETLLVDQDGLRDTAYEADAPSEINEIIRDLKSLNWYVQNPAIEKIKNIRSASFSPTSWFVLGRNIYQAACGNAQKAMNFIANLDIQLSRFDLDSDKYLLAGMVFEIYFDSEGKLRDKGKTGQLDKVISTLQHDRFAAVRNFIKQEFLRVNSSLVFNPSAPHDLMLEVKSELLPPSKPAEGVLIEEGDRYKLVSVKLDGVELLVDRIASEDSWFGFRSHYSMDDIVSEVSSALIIPKWAIRRTVQPTLSPNVIFRVLANKYLSSETAKSMAKPVVAD